MRVVPFVERLDWGEIDAQGRVTPRKAPTREGVDICPGPAGGKEWTHAAYSPRTRLLYHEPAARARQVLVVGSGASRPPSDQVSDQMIRQAATPWLTRCAT